MAEQNDAKLNDVIDQLAGSLKMFNASVASFNVKNLKTNFDLFNAQLIRTVFVFETVLGQVQKFGTKSTKSFDKLNKSTTNYIKKTQIAARTSDRIDKGERRRAARAYDQAPPDVQKFLDEMFAKRDAAKEKAAYNKDFGERIAKELAQPAAKDFGTIVGKILGQGAEDSYKALGGKRMGLGAGVAVAFTSQMKALSSITSFAVSAIKGFAIGLGALGALTAAFVKAFNPALVEQFTTTLKDLSAIIGMGLTPILMALNTVFRALADSLVPIFQYLAPAFQALGDAVVMFLTPIFMALTDVLKEIAPELNSLFEAFAPLLGAIGSLVGAIIRGLAPVLDVAITFITILANTLTPVINAFAYLADYVMPLVASYLVGFATLMVVDGVAALVAFITSLFTATAALNIATAGIPILIATLVGGLLLVVNFFKRLFETEDQRKKREALEAQKFGMSGASQGFAARQAQYTSTADLSANLIKAAFGGTTDRLKNIDQNGKRQVELLEKIAGEKNQKPLPAVAVAQPGAKA